MEFSEMMVGLCVCVGGGVALWDRCFIAMGGGGQDKILEVAPGRLNWAHSTTVSPAPRQH